MATLEEVQNFVDTYQIFEEENKKEIQKIVQAQRENESGIIQQTESACPINQLQDRTARPEDVERALKEGYGDASVLKTLMCLNNSMITFPKSAGIGRNFKVRKYLHNLRQIGEESAFGYAMVSDVITGDERGENLFVVKSPRTVDPKYRSEQVHEYFVGAFGTNNLRNSIPNFSYVLGFFQCSPPYIDEKSYLSDLPPKDKTRTALTYCQNDVNENEVNYILYENVTNAKTVKDFITEGASFEEFLNILIQVVLAIDYAQQMIDFTHYDLHYENVLVRELPKEITIPYVVNNGETKYLKTRYVATLIDYGKSHIKYKNKDYGYAEIRDGVFPDRSFPLYDVFKLLTSCFYAATYGDQDPENFIDLTDDQILSRGMATNPEIFQKGKELLAYFNPYLIRDPKTKQINTVSLYLIEMSTFNFILPYTSQFDVRALDFYEGSILISYPIEVKRLMSDRKPIDGLYGCENKGVCKTLQQAIKEFSVDDESLISDPYMFMESVIEGENGQGDLGSVIYRGQRHLNEYVNILSSDIKKFWDEYLQLMNGITIQSYVEIPDDLKLESQVLENYRNYVATAVKLIDLITTLGFIEQIFNKLFELYPEINYLKLDLEEIYQPIREEANLLNEVIRSLKQDVNYIQSLNSEDTIQKNPDSIWLFEKLPTLSSAINHLDI